MNIRHINLLFLFVSLFAVQLSGQGWERLYPDISQQFGAQVRKVLPAPGSGFFLLVSDQDGVTNQFDFHVVRIDDNGAVEWTRHYDFGANEFAEDMIATSDGGYAIVYRTFSPIDSTRTYLLRLDVQWNVVSNQALVEPALVSGLGGEQIIENQQKLHIFGTRWGGLPGTVVSRGFCQVYDLNGNAEDYVEFGADNLDFRSATRTPNGEFVATLSGYSPAAGQSIAQTIRLALPSAVPVWEVLLNNGNFNDYLDDVAAAPDGGYILSGGRDANGMLVKLDDSGVVLWQKEFPYHLDSVNFFGITHITPTADGAGYWAASLTNSYIPQIVLLRLDLQGNKLWQKTLGAWFTYNAANSLLALPDGLIGGGYNQAAIGQNQNLKANPYVFRTDLTGNTFLNGVSGFVQFDTDGDCAGDSDSSFYSTPVYAIQNGQVVSQGTVGQDGAYYIPLDTGVYQITTRRPNPAWVICQPDTLSVTVTAGDTLSDTDFVLKYDPQPVDSIFGSVFEDVDGDCVRDSFEIGRPDWTITLNMFDQGVEHSFTATSDANGYFIFQLTGITNAAYGGFLIAPPPNDGLNCHITCQEAFNLNFENGNSYQADFGLQCDSLPPCPVMDVDIATNVLRPCVESTYGVHYCNNGAVWAENAQVVLTFDSILQITSTSIPWSQVDGNAYTFDLGDLAPEQCGDFTVTVLLPCDEPVGKTYCVAAHAYPDTICAPAGVNWDGAQVAVSADCTGDSVIFTIRNVGTGDMVAPLNYIVIEDNVMLMQSPGQFQLDAGDGLPVSFAADGSFLRLEADQSPGFPGLNLPVAWAEGCGGNGAFSLGLANQFPLGDQEPWLDVFCLESVNSYDPNDKQGFPRGYDEEHYIGQNVELEYLIRFQNTGTAPALYVEIRDTIPVQWLDPTSVRPGASSHAYEWDMQGNGVVVFRFPDINLPDSSADAEASNGFVKFRVAQRPDVALGTRIENNAAIYFDNNDPVITNRTLHTVGKNFILTSTGTPLYPGLQVNVLPNPAHDRVQVLVKGLEKETEDLTFTLTAAPGVRVMSRAFAGTSLEFQAGQLPAGVYYYEIRRAGQVVATGKLIKV